MALFDTLPELHFFVKNRRGDFVYGSPSFVAMLGAAALADIRGRRDRDFSPQALAERFRRDDLAVLRGGRPILNRVELVPNSDGSISWHTTSKVPIRERGGAVVGLAGITRDLSRSGAGARRYRELDGVMRHIEAHYAGPLAVRELAALAHVSVSQFERRFKALFQTTPARFLVRFRLNQASQLLVSTAGKIADIATQCGFYDHSHFIRQFTRVYGLTPTAYRRRHG